MCLYTIHKIFYFIVLVFYHFALTGCCLPFGFYTSGSSAIFICIFIDTFVYVYMYISLIASRKLLDYYLLDFFLSSVHTFFFFCFHLLFFSLPLDFLLCISLFFMRSITYVYTRMCVGVVCVCIMLIFVVIIIWYFVIFNFFFLLLLTWFRFWFFINF